MSSILGNKKQHYISEAHIAINSWKERQALSLIELATVVELIPLYGSNNPKKVCLSKYDIEEMHNIKIPHKNKPLSLFHINACSLYKNFDDLQHLNCTKKLI